MNWSEHLTELNFVLAGLYPFRDDSHRIVEAAGLPIHSISFQNKGIDNWYEILRVATNQNKVIKVVQVALFDHPQNSFLIQASKGDLNFISGPDIKSKLDWNTDLKADTVEKLMGKQSTLLPISFLEVGLERSRAVARILLKDGGLATGFLAKNNMFVTNNHVLPNQKEADDGVIQFDYQLTANGDMTEPKEFLLDPGLGFATSVEDDWTLVKVKGNPNKNWGYLEVEKRKTNTIDRVNIIQHPFGGPKQFAIYHNIVTYHDEKRVQYLTDTQPGSSGSPVFDTHWKLVALHHSGGWMPEPDTDNKVFRNEGININIVAKALHEKFGS